MGQSKKIACFIFIMLSFKMEVATPGELHALYHTSFADTRIAVPVLHLTSPVCSDLKAKKKLRSCMMPCTLQVRDRSLHTRYDNMEMEDYLDDQLLMVKSNSATPSMPRTRTSTSSKTGLLKLA
jgi:hypothetical protein